MPVARQTHNRGFLTRPKLAVEVYRHDRSYQACWRFPGRYSGKDSLSGVIHWFVKGCFQQGSPRVPTRPVKERFKQQRATHGSGNAYCWNVAHPLASFLRPSAIASSSWRPTGPVTLHFCIRRSSLNARDRELVNLVDSSSLTTSPRNCLACIVS